MQTQISQVNWIAQVVLLMNDISGNLQKIAKIIYVEHCKNQNAAIELRKAVPQMDDNFINTLINVGAGRLDVRSVTWSCPATRIIKMMPGETQKKIYDTGEVSLVVTRDNKLTVVNKQINELTPAESRQVFTVIGLRPIEEQKKLLKRPTHRTTMVAQRYEIDAAGNLIVCEQYIVFTPAMMETIFAQMKAAQVKTLATRKVA
jgi:hypothetical protein